MDDGLTTLHALADRVRVREIPLDELAAELTQLGGLVGRADERDDLVPALPKLAGHVAAYEARRASHERAHARSLHLRGMQRYGEGIQNPRARQRALCIAAGPRQAELSELRELLRTAGVAVADELTQRRQQPDPDRYFGKGKR